MKDVSPLRGRGDTVYVTVRAAKKLQPMLFTGRRFSLLVFLFSLSPAIAMNHPYNMVVIHTIHKGAGAC